MPHPAVVQTVIAEGGFLDLATTGEVQLVQRLGVAPERCIHTHPIKRDSDIRNALDFGVRTFVADNPDEVRKFARLRRAARAAAARLVPRPRRGVRPVAQVRLRPGGPAGARARSRRDLGIEVRGLSFHVGSQAARCHQARRGDPGVREAAWRRRAARSSAASTRSTSAAASRSTTRSRCRTSAASARRCAPRSRKLPARVRVIAEPGRYIVGPAAIGVASVMGRAQREGHWWYYLDDGLYGSYSGQLLRPRALSGRAAARERRATALGARRPDLRQHRRDRREPHAAAAQGGRPDRRPRHGRLHLGERLGVQFLPEGDGGGGQRPARRWRQRQRLGPP